MAPHVKKAKTAFLYYQADQLSKIRQQLGPAASMGEAMTELAARWRTLTPDTKAVYLEQEAVDRARFNEASAAADAEVLAEQEARRTLLTVQQGEQAGSRGARARMDQERAVREEDQAVRRQRLEDDMDPEEAAERARAVETKRNETAARRQKKKAAEEAVAVQHKKLDKEDAKKATQRLEYLLQQSSIFAKLSGGAGSIPTQKSDATEKDNGESGKKDKRQRKPSATAKEAGKAGVHHIHTEDDDDDVADGENENEEEEETPIFLTQQPSSIKFGNLKPYQLEALNWMIHLAGKGLNGILADEMGLGKTLQSISILAYHHEFLKIQGPHLICVPKSTLSNWMNELKRWCPVLRVIKFHGSREDREYMVDNMFTNAAAAHDGKRPDKPQIMDEKGELVDDNSDNPRTWDVCVTTYEVANNESKTLLKFAWKYLIIDEAHRLKNDASLFSKTVRSFRTANRLLLTGTPLQNNLHELWALLNFLLPDIFSSAEQFDEWFDLEIDDEEAKKNMISQLHKILRPFMLRRLKADVAKGLPPKTETILMVGMSSMQKRLYKQLLLRDLDSITGKASGKNRTAVLNIVMQLRKCCGHPYLFEGIEDRTLDPLGDHLVDNCGKLSMVDKLLKRLKERGSRVLIFTQMTRVLDILEDFMVMRGYHYARIDGNTDYNDREFAIDDFNKDGSDKFCFLLSTRAGGLGINLQTADTCILYDSDWNPQQDLQAQDRCHRLGQKKPVNIFRLVSENTVEEKIVERAQQKLKLDAMVVQQGRLKDKDKVTKDEIMAAVRFGADSVFRSDESTITDVDIDIILERGKAKTKELKDKISKAEKGDLLDFRLDGGMSAQTYEGVDYSDRELRAHLQMLAANSVGKRDRRPPPMNYNPIIHSKKSMVVNNRRIKLPKCLRIPQMEDHHFYNRERLLELGSLEFETYAALREVGQVPPREVMERNRTLLPDDVGKEKLELLDEGFGDWSRSNYYHFVKACAKYGRDDFASIAAEMDMPEASIESYSRSFWEYGPTELKSEWDRVTGNIDRGEKKLAKQKKLSALLTKFVSTFENPRQDMIFANKGTAHFALEQDRALLCAVDKHGYGNWDSVREEIRTDSVLKFQHSAQGMTVQAIGKRCDYRMRQMEKELEAREKNLKNVKPPNVVAAHKTIDAIKEMDLWDMQVRESQLEGEEANGIDRLSFEARQVMEERLKDRASGIGRLREIEVQVQRCLGLAEDTRNAIAGGAQYVNYSNITLKAGGPALTGKDEKTGQTVQDGVNLEARINPAVLRVPACLQCGNCLNSNTKLCFERLQIRNRLLKEEEDRLNEIRNKLEKKKTKKRKAEPSPKKSKPSVQLPPLASTESSKVKKPKQLMMKKPDGQLKIRVTSQGNKRMTIPEELFPDFCQRIGAEGTGERMKLINQFVEENPTISVRQVTMKLADITTRDRPGCISLTERKGGRAFIFYLRPCFYKHLPPDERPEDWEAYAAEDETLWEEQTLRKREETKKDGAGSSCNGSLDGQSNGGKETPDQETPDQSLSRASQTGKIIGNEDNDEDDVDDDDDDNEADEDEEEEEGETGEPDLKRTKLEDEYD